MSNARNQEACTNRHCSSLPSFPASHRLNDGLRLDAEAPRKHIIISCLRFVRSMISDEDGVWVCLTIVFSSKRRGAADKHSSSDFASLAVSRRCCDVVGIFLQHRVLRVKSVQDSCAFSCEPSTRQARRLRFRGSETPTTIDHGRYLSQRCLVGYAGERPFDAMPMAFSWSMDDSQMVCHGIFSVLV